MQPQAYPYSKDHAGKNVAKKPCRTSVVCSLLTCALMSKISFGNLAVAEDINIQRLFTTPEERAAIDAGRLAGENDTETTPAEETFLLTRESTEMISDDTNIVPENFAIFYHGSFGSTDISHVWINGSLIDLVQFTDVLQVSPQTRDLLVYSESQQYWIPLKAGQILYLRRNVVTDSMQEVMNANTPAITNSMSETEHEIQQPEFITLLRRQTQ